MKQAKPTITVRQIISAAALFLFLLGTGTPALAVLPDVKTVPWVATNPLIPHDTWNGKSIRLKGTANVQGANFQYSWDFGDGSTVATGTVTNQYVIEASHAYTGSVGDIFTARLTVEDTNTGETGSATYFVAIQNQELGVEVNVAIDEGLWYLHKTMRRFVSGVQDVGDWDQGTSCGSYCASTTWHAITPANVNAFFVNGHLETGSASNPYTETVQRAMKMVIANLQASAIPSSQTNGLGTFNPDANGNGLGIQINQSQDFYQGGMFIDALVASGTPAAVSTTGPVNVVGRTYADIVQDMVDFYSYCQYDASAGGGWRYSCNAFPDGSVAQWAAIGLIAAERSFGTVIPQIVKDWNRVWVDTSHNNVTGVAGYTSVTPVWGPYATTPSATVQMAMDGIGRGNAWWDASETFLRDNFGNSGSAGVSIRDYYYGLFSFTKSMLLHDSNGDNIAEPIVLLQSSTPGVTPLDWYAAQVSSGDPTDGVARTLVNDQAAGGYWYAHNFSGSQYPFETSWAIIMLNRTVFASGVPVAVAQATPNPGVVGQTITLDGSGSFHQDGSKNIDSWEWDVDNDGTFDLTGAVVTTSFGALGDFPVTLRVTDDASPEESDDTVLTVRITTPPIAPTANADGPYVFCPQTQPWFLDGTGSVNPDEGVGEPGAPGDTIQEYAWEMDGDNAFDDAFGA
ncbi:MAG: PKD domain-containing protein, partial [Halobacteria archaeon]|nr:PKD domain-containing protein [Halobacteria archaeon]